MSQITQPARHLATSGRRKLLIFGLAVLVFAVVSMRAALEAQPTSSPSPILRSAAPAVTSVDQDPVTYWQNHLAHNPDDADAYAQLGVALLQRIRITNDATLYPKAQQALDQALTRDAQQIDGLVGRGMLALSLHNFRDALRWADRVLAANPYRAAGLGIRVDALVELGRYPDAIAALQQMVDLRPDLEAYSRVSYLRELHGDMAGAIAAMQMAASTAEPGSEPWLWTTTQLANLYWNEGKLDKAEELYRTVLRQRADYPFAQAGMARVFGARGRTDEAYTILRPLVARLPLPDFLMTLGELYEANGETRLANEQYDMVHVIEQLNAAAGMNVDLELATVDVLHGTDIRRALTAAQAAYAERPTVFAAGTLAWALHRAGRDAEAQHYSQEALRLGTQDARLHFHAGMIALALGDRTSAHQHFAAARTINPYFSPVEGKLLQEQP